MLTIEKLKNFGADTEDGLKRCMNMEDFYISLVQSALDDTQLKDLKTAIDEDNLSKAFETAHALKGIYANLSLTPLLEPVSEIAELLRAGTRTDYAPLLAKAEEMMKNLKEIAE